MKLVSNGVEISLPVIAGSLGNVYSTDEQVIGKWINGSLIWRKSVEFSVNGTRFTIVPPEHDKIIDLKLTPYGEIEIFDNMFASGSDVCRCWYNRRENLIYMDISSMYNVSSAVLTIDYTKVEDLTE